jgi:hypothetical protein
VVVTLVVVNVVCDLRDSDHPNISFLGMMIVSIIQSSFVTSTICVPIVADVDVVVEVVVVVAVVLVVDEVDVVVISVIVVDTTVSTPVGSCVSYVIADEVIKLIPIEPIVATANAIHSPVSYFSKLIDFIKSSFRFVDTNTNPASMLVDH